MIRYVAIIMPTFFMLTACVSDDPRQGGFIGGVASLSSGAYDRRIAARENSLARLQGIQQDLEIDNARLQQQKNASTNEINRLNRKISSLDSDIRSLRKKIAKLKKNGRISASEVRNADQRAGNIQSAINNQKQNLMQAKKASSNSSEIAAIEANIEALKQQLKNETERALLMVR